MAVTGPGTCAPYGRAGRRGRGRVAGARETPTPVSKLKRDPESPQSDRIGWQVVTLRTDERANIHQVHPGHSLAKGDRAMVPEPQSSFRAARLRGLCRVPGADVATDSVPDVSPGDTEQGQQTGGELGPGGQLLLLKTSPPPAAAQPRDRAGTAGASRPPASAPCSPTCQPCGRGRVPERLRGAVPICRAGQHPCLRGRWKREASV